RQGYRIVSFIGQCLVSRLEVKGNVASLCSFGRKGRTRRLLTRGIGSTPGAQGLLQTFAIPGERPLRTGYSHQKQKDQRVKCERIMEVMVESFPVRIPFDLQPLLPVLQLLGKPNDQPREHSNRKKYS